MTFTESIKTCFKKYFDFHGRALRSEFWYFQLFYWMIFVLSIILEVIFLSNSYSFGSITDFIWLIFIIPHINVTTRRLHDVNRSGWWQLLYFTIIGGFVILYWCIIKGRDEGNKYN